MLRDLERVREALKQAGTADTSPLTATMALSQLQQAAMGSPASGAAAATPGPRTPSGLRYTGVDKVDSAGRTTIGAPAGGARAQPPPFAPSATKAGGKLKLIGIAGLVVVIAGIATGMMLRGRGKTPAGSTVAAPVNSANHPAAVLPDSAENHWVRVVPPAAGAVLILGVAESADQRGFRPARRVTAPNEAFELQQHEVTWGELDPWLASHLTIVPATPAWLPADLSARKNLPVTGLRWTDAQQYCKSLGGSLPSEEQWEFAARGASLRPNAWGAQRPDAQRMRFFAGADAQPAPVMSSEQDRTPGAESDALYDLTGNVQEWTVDLWREDAPGQDESWVQEGPTSFRAIRGLPLTAAASANLPPIGAAWREPLCATGLCLEKTKAKLQAVGFRCARNSGG